MKAPPLDSEGTLPSVAILEPQINSPYFSFLVSLGLINMETQEVMALARGGYAELLLVQENRRSEGEKMKSWSETAWRNRRISLAEALTLSEPLDKVGIIDARTTRVL
ncbi:unnamed protein product [Brassica oleracea]